MNRSQNDNRSLWYRASSAAKIERIERAGRMEEIHSFQMDSGQIEWAITALDDNPSVPDRWD
jgi:hypothetical protein